MQCSRFRDLSPELQEAYDKGNMDKQVELCKLDKQLDLQEAQSIWKGLKDLENTRVFYKVESEKPVLFALVIDYRDDRLFSGLNLIRISSLVINKTNPVEKLVQMQDLSFPFGFPVWSKQSPNIFGIIGSMEQEYYKDALKTISFSTGKETRMLSKPPPFLNKLEDVTRLSFYNSLLCILFW